MNKQTAKLENWSIMGFTTSPYQAPEQAQLGLVGIVSGHPRLEDGISVRTSQLKMISYKNKIAVTRNTVYSLGEPDPDFLKFLKEGGHKIEEYEFGKLDN